MLCEFELEPRDTGGGGESYRIKYLNKVGSVMPGGRDLSRDTRHCTFANTSGRFRFTSGGEILGIFSQGSEGNRFLGVRSPHRGLLVVLHGKYTGTLQAQCIVNVTFECSYI